MTPTITATIRLYQKSPVPEQGKSPVRARLGKIPAVEATVKN